MENEYQTAADDSEPTMGEELEHDETEGEPGEDEAGEERAEPAS